MRSPSKRLYLDEFELRVVPTLFHVGPGQTYPTLHQVPWDSLHPGDVVQVEYQTTPYHDKVAISVSGNAANPIKIEGVADSSGHLPVLDAAGAIENSTASYYSYEAGNEGVFTLAPKIWNQTVNWITISGFEIENANRDNTFIDANGQLQWWNWGATSIALYCANHITIEDCIIHDNENGLFGKSYGWDEGNLHDIMIENNTIYGNGRVGENHYHNTYLEAIGITYQFNHFGPTLAGSAGVNVKDRSAGLVFRYNYVEGGVTMLDLVEPDDGGLSMVEDPLFGKTYVYGNILYNPPGAASSIVHFGGDNGFPPLYQRNLYFYDNTVVDRNDQSTGRWRTIIFDVTSNAQTVWAENNILFNMPETPYQSAGYWCIAETEGTFHLGVNWINSGYLDSRDGLPFDGTIYGEDNLITGNNPWFVDAQHQDFRLQSGSHCIGTGMSLSSHYANHPVEYQFDYTTGTWVHRDSTDDLGAIESE